MTCFDHCQVLDALICEAEVYVLVRSSLKIASGFGYTCLRRRVLGAIMGNVTNEFSIELVIYERSLGRFNR